MKWLNRALIAAGVAAGTYAAVSAAMARGLTRNRRIVADDTPASVGLPYEAIRFPSRDKQLELDGWLIPPPGYTDMREAMAGRWIVTVHGHSTNRTDPAVGLLGLARDLHDRGFGTLLFDMRASGSSEGETASAGYYERLDLLGALDYLAARGAKKERTGVLGFSLGGAVALMVCSDPGAVAAVVADSAFADLRMMIKRSQKGRNVVLSFVNPGMSLMARVIYGLDIHDVSPAHSVAASETPVFIIHGEDDRLVPPKHARIIARAAGSDFKELDENRGKLWIVPGAGHVQAYRTHPAEYIERVTQFFNVHLKQ
jgi:dipeptidyl aminopeptidase/acylaminoacyl peptidase